MLELDGATLTYEEFRLLCLEPNCPAVIRNACKGAGTTYFNVTELLHRLSPQTLCDTLGAQTLVPVYQTHFTVTRNCAEAKDSLHDRSCKEGRATHEPACACETTAPTTATATVTASLEKAEEEEENEGDCRELPLNTVLQSWACSSSDTAAAAPPRVYYLKDWHLQEALERAAVAGAGASLSSRDSPASAAFAASVAQRKGGVHGNALYRVPEFLGADWVDPFCRYVFSEPRQRLGSADTSSAGVAAAAAGGQQKEMEDRNAPIASTRVGFGNCASDYRFAYIGPVGSWTPLHCDVFGTYSWSFNVCGDKLWFFPTPSGNAYLHEHLLPFFPTPPDMRVLTGFEIKCVVQHPGDLVFVPARFYHQVHNISGESFPLLSCPNQADSEGEWEAASRATTSASSSPSLPSSRWTVGPLTMAINHNWCNVFNIDGMIRTFLGDARQLVSHLSVDDLEVICGTKDERAWKNYVDKIMHRGTNWSFASVTCFLEFCASQMEASVPGMVARADERDMAVSRVRGLLSEVREFHEHLFKL